MTLLMRSLSATLVLAAATAVAWCFPSLYGDTGLILTPSANVAPYATVDMGVDYMKVGVGEEHATAYPVRVAFGMGGRLETSFLFAEALGNGNGFDVKGLGAKYALFTAEDSVRVPSMAVGVRFDQFKVPGGDEDVTEVYGVFSKSLYHLQDADGERFNLLVNAGGSYTTYSVGGNDQSFISPFAGFIYRSGTGTEAAVDFVVKQEKDGVEYRKSTLSGVIRHPISNHSWLEIGSTRAFGFGEDQSYFLGFVRHFDGNEG